MKIRFHSYSAINSQQKNIQKSNISQNLSLLLQHTHTNTLTYKNKIQLKIYLNRTYTHTHTSKIRNQIKQNQISAFMTVVRYHILPESKRKKSKKLRQAKRNVYREKNEKKNPNKKVKKNC